MACLRPDVCDHDCLAVTTNGITQEVCQFRLSVWNMSTLLGGEGEDDLLEETERLVDEAGFFEDESSRASLLRHLTTGEIDEVKL